MHNASPHFAQDEDLEDGGNQAQTIHLPSYADLNSISQFNYPDDYLGSSRIYVSNNLKVSAHLKFICNGYQPMASILGRPHFPHQSDSEKARNFNQCQEQTGPR